MMRKTPLRKVSKAQSVRLKEYAKLRKSFLEENPICQARVQCLTFAPNRASQVHHKKRRGVNLLKVEHFLAVCAVCHRFLHDNPKFSRENGLLE